MGYKEAFNHIKDCGALIEIDEDLRRKIQKELLEMYGDILRACQKYSIVPFLGGGSALGAIRHKGFIPWDDDLDINMTREDYLIFQSVFEKELSDKYILNAPNYSLDAISRFPRIMKRGTKYVEIGATNDERLQCLAIDVFLIDAIPENGLYRKIKGCYCNALEFIAGRVSSFQNRSATSTALLKAAGMKWYLLDRIVGFLFSYRKYSAWNDKVDRAVLYDGKSRLCGFPTGRKHYFGEIHEREKLFPEVYVGFENIQAPVFKGYDYYLTMLYGQYMQIPPVEKREKHFVERVEL